MRVQPEQRFTQHHACPVCGGFDAMRRGDRERCHGYISSDNIYAHCSREEFANGIEMNPNSQTFPHRLAGGCKCGKRHDETTPATLTPDRPTPSPQKRTRARGEIAYEYQDAEGRTLFRVLRTPDKRFFQQVPDRMGGWKNGLSGTKPVLYRLPEILSRPHDKLFVVEGEKDADRLARLGLLATTSPMGGGKWREDYTAALAKHRGGIGMLVPNRTENALHFTARLADGKHEVRFRVAVQR